MNNPGQERDGKSDRTVEQSNEAVNDQIEIFSRRFGRVSSLALKPMMARVQNVTGRVRKHLANRAENDSFVNIEAKNVGVPAPLQTLPPIDDVQDFDASLPEQGVKGDISNYIEPSANLPSLEPSVSQHLENSTALTLESSATELSIPDLIEPEYNIRQPQELDDLHAFKCELRDIYEGLKVSGHYSGLAIRYDDIEELRFLAGAIDCQAVGHNDARFRIDARRRFEALQDIALDRACYAHADLMSSGVITHLCTNKQLILLSEVILKRPVAQAIVAMEWKFASDKNAKTSLGRQPAHTSDSINADIIFSFDLSPSPLDLLAVETNGKYLKKGRVDFSGGDSATDNSFEASNSSVAADDTLTLYIGFNAL